jgi:hypothetical protein
VHACELLLLLVTHFLLSTQQALMLDTLGLKAASLLLALMFQSYNESFTILLSLACPTFRALIVPSQEGIHILNRLGQ